MAELEGEVRQAVRAVLRPAPLPATDGGLVTELGGPAAVARAVLRIPPDQRLPARGTDARRGYDRMVRRFYRRGDRPVTLDPGLRKRLRAIYRRGAAADRRRAVLKRGWRARLLLILNVMSASTSAVDVRQREVPQGGPGVYLSPDEAELVLEAYDENEGEVGEVFFTAFSNSYGWDLDTDDIGDVIWVKIWIDGEQEP